MITIALPVYNRASILGRFIESVLSQTYQDLELIVVDDGSKDNSYKIAVGYSQKDPRILCFKHLKNKGLPAARNTAIKLSHGELIFFGEDDIVLNPTCIEILVKTFAEIKSKCRVGAVGPRLISESSTSNNKNCKDFNIVKMNALTGDLSQDWSADGCKITEVPSLHACSLISKEVFNEIGGYDTELYRGNYIREETDLYFRTKKAGFKLFFQPNAVAHHLHFSNGGCRMPLVKRNYYSVRNHYLFLVRFFGLRALYMIPSFSIWYLLSIPSGMSMLKEKKSAQINSPQELLEDHLRC